MNDFYEIAFAALGLTLVAGAAGFLLAPDQGHFKSARWAGIAFFVCFFLFATAIVFFFLGKGEHEATSERDLASREIAVVKALAEQESIYHTQGQGYTNLVGLEALSVSDDRLAALLADEQMDISVQTDPLAETFKITASGQTWHKNVSFSLLRDGVTSATCQASDSVESCLEGHWNPDPSASAGDAA